MFSKIRKQGAQMVESFKDAGVVDSRSVEQDAEDEEDEAGDSEGAVDERPNELSVLFRFDCLYHVGETEKSLGC